MPNIVIVFALSMLAAAATAADILLPGALDWAAATPRECFLAAAIGAMITCGLASFLLFGRVTERTHVALAMLVVLIGAFGLFTLFGLATREIPAVGALVLLALLGLFKLMNQFEINRKPRQSRN
jgi:hypothetical protein